MKHSGPIICAALAPLLVTTLALVSAPAWAQSPAPTGAESPAPEETVKMSAFEVTTTQGHGYVEGNSASAFKTSEPLMDIPQVDIVVTNDLIQDVGYENSSDVLAYFGLMPGFQGESLKMRGIGIAYPYLDDMPVNSVFFDDYVIDSYEVIKGPTESLYVNSSLAGVVLKNLKHPLPYQQYIFTADYNEYAGLRLTADFAGPVGKVGATSVNYRLIGVYQNAGSYFDNTIDHRIVLMPEVGITYKNTSIILAFDYQDFHSESNGFDYMTPSGNLFTSAGWRFSGQGPGQVIHWEQHIPELEIRQKISDSWETRLRSQLWEDHRYGPDLIPSNYDWATQTAYMTNRLDNFYWKYWTILLDTNGRYTLGPPSWEMKNIDSFGTAISIWTYHFAGWVYSPFGEPFNGQTLHPDGQKADTYAVPMTRAAFNAIPTPTLLDYNSNPPADEGSRVDTNLYSLYWQHSVDVIPNWLRLVAGWTWDANSSQLVTNISQLPWNAQYVPVSIWIHRLGAIFHVTKDIGLYALDSQSFTPPNSSSVLAIPPSGVQTVIATPGTGESKELGLKSNFMGGRLSIDFAWFHMKQSGILVTGGVLNNGSTYSVEVAARTEGVDGDVSFTLVPGWQLIGTWYAGHSRDFDNVPVSGTYDNSWTLFTRYDFPSGIFHHLAIGGGFAEEGGRWLNVSGSLLNAGLSTNSAGTESNNIENTYLLKVRQMQVLDGFVTYQFDKHFMIQANFDNILNKPYAVGYQADNQMDPGPPFNWSIQGIYKF